MRRFIHCWLAVLVTGLGCSGPSYDSTVTGTVTVDGELAQRGRVVFHPVNDGPPAYGNIFPNGSYSLRVGQGDLEDVDGGELASGEYIVTVVVNTPSVASETVGEGGAPTPGARITAAKYAEKSLTDLRSTVKPGPNVMPLELEGAAVDEVVEDVGTTNGTSAEDATPNASTEAESTGAAVEPALPTEQPAGEAQQ